MAFSDEEIERYARHLVLSEIGGPGQQKLAAARILIVGVGGVGGPAALYLAAAGVGTIGLVDADTVGLSNLQRQIAFATDDVGRGKVEVVSQRLTALNPHVRIEAHPVALSADNAARLVTGHDLIIDGTDDFQTRFTVNAACVAAGVPLVSGALGRWSGQVGIFSGQPCYRCLVAEAPSDAETCARVGVVGALAGIVGAMTALEAIKEITGAGEPLTGRLLLYDGLSATARTVRVTADPDCPVCARV
ncbi:molybdopterin-synthase adenylyltransferase MoeB [Brevundimonas variabilis]|uniref:Molybdopterin-synthase adenylyltransferase n=1 Tax=Brevundimonas variabilis TaxID=74312 RepID=A0A7W9CFR1_9CAUL|nr:molybdopterin/thiamine biosynthesis adenylyltransferase [Brevundimonas variabilis]